MPESEAIPSPRFSTSAPAPAREENALDIAQVLHRQRWLIAFCVALGLAAGVAYALTSEVWYESDAKILINERSAGLSSNTGTDSVEDDVLATHIELLRSRKIVGNALQRHDLMELASIQPHLKEDDDAIDYVVNHLEIAKGGEGSAKTARSLRIALTHTDPVDVKKLLEAIVVEYQDYLREQVEQVMSMAGEKIAEAKETVQGDLKEAEERYTKLRQEAPLLFQGEGSSNVYQDKYRKLQDELVNLDIQESTLKTRLERVEESLAEMDDESGIVDHLDKLALIDSESLERLGLFTGLQMSAADTAEFKAMMPAKAEEASARFEHLLRLQAEKQRLMAQFGSGHTKVKDVESEISLVKEFIDQSVEESTTEAPFGNSPITPETLLRAYVGFLNHDLATLAERKIELMRFASQAEDEARDLIEHEIKDLMTRKDIERNEALFDGVVHQLRELNTASGLSGYLYELLNPPQLGRRVWPSLPICALGGVMFGLFSGLGLGLANDIRDGRFKTVKELEDTINLPSLGRVGRLNSIRRGVRGLIAAELSPDAEAFRLGRTLLLPDVRNGSLRSLGVTSPMQGDGKSTITSNLAASFSQVGLSVLVIDADLRRPTLHRYFSIKPEGGLADILVGNVTPEDAAKETNLENVSVITAGASTQTPAELLQSERFDQVLEELKGMFDLIIIDLPPVLAVSDPIVVAPRLDGNVMVIRSATARRDEVLNAIRRVRTAGGTFVGCVLNTFGSAKRFVEDGGSFGYYASNYSRPTNRTKPVMATSTRATATASPNGKKLD